ncbi:hypothetical protein GCM10009540_60850 [Streptomyces turgidiscabies]
MNVEVEVAVTDICNAAGIPRADVVAVTVDTLGVTFSIIARDDNGDPMTNGDGIYLVRQYYAL